MRRFFKNLLSGNTNSLRHPVVRRPRSAGLEVQQLEERLVLSYIPFSASFAVDGISAGDTRDSSDHTVARASNGDFAVVWENFHVGAPGIYARVFDSWYVPLTAAIHVGFTDMEDSHPSVAINNDDTFVVAWRHELVPGSASIKTQRFDAQGLSLGPTAVASPGIWTNVYDPSVGIDNAGNYVVAYTSQSASSKDVLATLYTQDGTVRNDLVVANSGQNEYRPSVAMNADGNFVVGYVYDYSATDQDVYARRFDATGTPQGNSFGVATSIRKERDPSVAINANGDFVIAYTYVSNERQVSLGSFANYTITDSDIYAARYNAAGSRQGQTTVTNTTANNQTPSVALDGDGNFVVVYASGGDIYHGASNIAQRVRVASFNSAGTQRDGIASTAGSTDSEAIWGSNPSVALDYWGNPAVVYTSVPAGGDRSGLTSVCAQLFTYSPFQIQVTSPIGGLLQVTNGTSAQAQVTITRDPGFTGVIDVSPTGLASDLHLSVSPGSAFALPVETRTVTLRADAVLDSAGEHQFWVQATSSGYTATTNPLRIYVTKNNPAFTGLSTLYGYAPQSLRPGSSVTLYGGGFASGSKVQFGDPSTNEPDLQATPLSINHDGTEMEVEVPRMALDGPLTVIFPAGGRITGSDTFHVSNYRNTDAFSFHNISFNVSFPLVSDTFGEQQTHVTIHIPWPVDEDVITPIPDPGALVFTAAAAAAFNDKGGCFGMALMAQRLAHHADWINADNGLPEGQLPTVFNLQPNGNLFASIEKNFLVQWSTEVIRYFVGWQAVGHSSSSVYSQIQEQLQAHEHPLLSIRDDGGHVVTAYDLEPGNGPNDYYIDVYDNNREFIPSLEPGKLLQQGRDSRIHVTADNQWSFTMANGDHWSGGFGTLMVIPYSEMPENPTLPDSVDGLEQWIFGNASAPQASDAGRGMSPLAADVLLRQGRNTELGQAGPLSALGSASGLQSIDREDWADSLAVSRQQQTAAVTSFFSSRLHRRMESMLSMEALDGSPGLEEMAWAQKP
jgi:hypothetical protein